MNALVSAFSRPFGAAGALVRSAMVFARGGGLLLMSRWQFDYETEIGDPASNSIVGAVVGWIARNFPEAPVRIVRESDPEAPISRATPGIGRLLRLLENPNGYYSGVLQWRATIVDFIRGDAYWFKVRNPRDDAVVELWWVPARMVEPRWDEHNPRAFIDWYEYTVDGVAYRVEKRNVVHYRNGINPSNPRKGRDQLEALIREIFTDEEAADFTASLLRNLGVPGVILAPANTTSGMFKKLDTNTDAIKEKFKSSFGGSGRGEPLILTAPTDVKVISFNPQQMDLKALRRIPEERISGNLGVPAGVAQLGAGLDRNTFTNYGEARVAAYTEGVIPLHRLIAAEIELQLLPDFVGSGLDDLDVIFDVSTVAAMAEWQSGREKAAAAAAKGGLITRADYKRAAGRKPAPDGSDDVYLIANNIRVVPAGETVPPSTPGRRQLGPGPSTAPVGLLEPGEAAGPVRCQACDRLLAEVASPPYRFTCRCGTVNEEAAAPAAA